MSHNPEEGFPRVFPHVYFEDVAAALEWLPKAFGFREVPRWTAPDGTVGFAEMESCGAAIMLGRPGPGVTKKTPGLRVRCIHRSSRSTVKNTRCCNEVMRAPDELSTLGDSTNQVWRA
jgi:uncharacterized glyoxalase superfamily protein PhnB